MSAIFINISLLTIIITLGSAQRLLFQLWLCILPWNSFTNCPEHMHTSLWVDFVSFLSAVLTSFGGQGKVYKKVKSRTLHLILLPTHLLLMNNYYSVGPQWYDVSGLPFFNDKVVKIIKVNAQKSSLVIIRLISK